MASHDPRDRRPVEHLDTDLLVVGAGAAGVAAAVTAARAGVRVTLVERYGFCGGAAVAGLSGTICGLYAASPSRGAAPKKIAAGFVDEFMAALTARGGLTGPIRYGDTHTHVHDPQLWREVADGLVAAAGVQVLFHALVTAVYVDGAERIEGVSVQTKQGRVDVYARQIIDASGDADLVAMAGFGTTVGRDGVVQNPTMIFRIQGVDVQQFLAAYGPDSILPAEVSALLAAAEREGLDLPRKKIFLFPTPRPGELLCNATRIIGADRRELNVLRFRDFTEAEMLGRKQPRDYLAFFRRHLAGCEHAFINDTGVQVGIRQTRQIVGVETLTNDDVMGARKRADGIARSAWPIELHAGDKPKLVWLHDDYYEIPYKCFVPVRGEGLLAAGRCLSAEHEAMASARVTAQCFAYGQAVGLAASVALRERVEPRALTGEFLRDELRRAGVALD